MAKFKSSHTISYIHVSMHLLWHKCLYWILHTPRVNSSAHPETVLAQRTNTAVSMYRVYRWVPKCSKRSKYVLMIKKLTQSYDWKDLDWSLCERCPQSRTLAVLRRFTSLGSLNLVSFCPVQTTRNLYYTRLYYILFCEISRNQPTRKAPTV